MRTIECTSIWFHPIPSSLEKDVEGTVCYQKYCPASSNYDLAENCRLKISSLIEERKRREEVHFLAFVGRCCFSLANGDGCAG
jgi:hypothetical protein